MKQQRGREHRHLQVFGSRTVSDCNSASPGTHTQACTHHTHTFAKRASWATSLWAPGRWHRAAPRPAQGPHPSILQRVEGGSAEYPRTVPLPWSERSQWPRCRGPNDPHCTWPPFLNAITGRASLLYFQSLGHPHREYSIDSGLENPLTYLSGGSLLSTSQHCSKTPRRDFNNHITITNSFLAHGVLATTLL